MSGVPGVLPTEPHRGQESQRLGEAHRPAGIGVGHVKGAYCLELRRTAIGPFSISEAVAPPARGDEWPDPPLIALDHALAMLSREPRS